MDKESVKAIVEMVEASKAHRVILDYVNLIAADAALNGFDTKEFDNYLEELFSQYEPQTKEG